MRSIVADDASISLSWKDFPNTSLHPEALNAAVAARCAGEQDLYWEYSDYLLSNQSSLGEDLYFSISSELEMKERAFTNCYDDQDPLSDINAGYSEGIDLRVASAPTIYIEDNRFTGEMNSRDLKQFIETNRP
jgi:protein-disulfide isomerase